MCGEKHGGASRDRTDDLIVANDALSQLSYSPTSWKECCLDFTSATQSGKIVRGPRRPEAPRRGMRFRTWQSSLRTPVEKTA
jgi:hypothetical protein